MTKTEADKVSKDLSKSFSNLSEEARAMPRVVGEVVEFLSKKPEEIKFTIDGEEKKYIGMLTADGNPISFNQIARLNNGIEYASKVNEKRMSEFLQKCPRKLRITAMKKNSFGSNCYIWEEA